MAQLIDLTVTRRKSANKDDSFATPLTYGFDVEDIVVPIRSDGSDSYFTARQLKGTNPSSRQVGNTDYEVSETLAQVAAKSDLLVLLTVTKRRGVDVASEEHVFVTSRFSENIKESDTGGSKFFYQEDGDVNLVEYEVSETIAQIVTQSNVPAGGFIEVTYAEAQALIAACALVEGEHYKITDRADGGIMLLAVTPCSFSLEGEGVFLNPDFQVAGDYSGVPAYSSTLGVWTTAIDATVVNGDVVFWDGLHYETTDATSVDGVNNPSVNNLAYTLLAKAGTGFGYIEEVDFILYDFDNDIILERHDKRENKVYNFSSIGDFQWGNNSVVGNIVNADCRYDCINNKGYIVYNTVLLSATVNSTNANIGAITNSVFSNSVCTADFTTGRIKKCIINSPYTLFISFDSTIDHDGKEINALGSTFEATIDAFAAGVLTIPANLNYIGVFTLDNASGSTITSIVNLPTNHRSRFYAKAGETQLFSHAAVAGATTDQLVSDAAAINTITGRTNGSDFIEYERAGDLNRRYNAVILA